MARKKKPDKLSQEVAQALACGMSYGKWKAMQDPVKIEKKDVVPDGWRVCEWCKKPFKPTTRRYQAYCEPYCRNEAYKEKMREKKRSKS